MRDDEITCTRVIDAIIRINRTERPSLFPLPTQRTPTMSTGQHTLPPLPYAYEGLEPYISRQIMTLHHTKHHQTYVNALNAAEQAYASTKTPRERIALQAALKFNGGGT